MKRQNKRSLLLVVVVMAYILLGAAVFERLEASNEEENWKVLEEDRKAIQKKFNLSENAWEEITNHLVDYMPHRAGFQWRYAGAVYFSTTVITTIGYGHSTPKTNWGKIFCMLYALVGIPLNLVMFQSIGERLNTFNTFVIWSIRKKVNRIKTRFFCNNLNKVGKKEEKESHKFYMSNKHEDNLNTNKVDYYIQVNDMSHHNIENEQPKKKVYINLNKNQRCNTILEDNVEIFMPTYNNLPKIRITHEKNNSNEHLDHLQVLNSRQSLERLKRASLNEILSSSFTSTKFHLSDTNLICVTTTISSILVAGGAYAYSRFEGWTYLDSLYYCIITLTTVGFGDLVALQNNKELQKKPAFVGLNILFILTGLAVVSAAMNLLVLRFLTMNTEDEQRDFIKEKILHSREDYLSDLPKLTSSCEINLSHEKTSKCGAIKKLIRLGRHYICDSPSSLDSSSSPLRCEANVTTPNFLQIPKNNYLQSEKYPNPNELPSTFGLYHSRSRLLTL